LLLPLAALGGWVAAIRHGSASGKPRAFRLDPDYLKGLNYLLSDQPDRGVDVFVHMLELGPDTFDTYLALGNFFRKRGEVDRAIRIHLNLIDESSIDGEQRSDALLELGQDYLRAGLLDRAEAVFQELLRNNIRRPQVLPWLLEVYQHERDWDNAIRIATQMECVGERPAGAVIAQFYCEMADVARQEAATDRARGLLKRALSSDSQCVRASILLGDIERQAGRHETALAAYACIADQDAALLPEVLESMYACHRELDTVNGMIEYLRGIIPQCRSAMPVLILTDILATERCGAEATGFIADHLAENPSIPGLAKYIELRLADDAGAAQENKVILNNLKSQLQQDRPVYACQSCGFSGKLLHWQCPGCRQWDTVKPIPDAARIQ
jgi:lipopolysaccharide biosynthesis regulator YciM